MTVYSLKTGTILPGVIGQDDIVGIANQNYLNNAGYAFGKTSGGQTLINSNTSIIRAIKNMEIVGNLNVTNNISASTFASIDWTLTNFNTTEIVAFKTNSRYINTSNIETLNINTSKINTSNVSASNIIANAISSQGCNVSNFNSCILNTLNITADDVTIKENGWFRMKTGSNHGELKANSTKFNISCSNALYLSLAHHNKERINIYSNNIDLNTDTNISGKLNVSEISTSSIATDLVTASSIVTVNMSADNMSGSNMSIINDLSVGGVLTAPNINLTGLTSLVIGNALMGNSHHGGYAFFCHRLCANTIKWEQLSLFEL